MTKNARRNVRDQRIQDLFDRYSREFSDFDGLSLQEPNQCGYGEDAPLHVAARHGLLDDIALLIEAGASIDQKGELGFSALHYAAIARKLDAVEMLLRLGASPRLKNEFDQTPADVAALEGNTEVEQLLRKHERDSQR